MIKVESHQNRLRLVIPSKYYSPRYYYLELPNEPQYLPIAYQLKHLIDIDIATGNFDKSLEKYKPRSSDNLSTIWDQYVLFKSKQLHPSSMKNLLTVSNHIKKIPLDILNNPSSLKLWLINYLSPEQARRVLMQIKAAANWGLEMNFLTTNPYKIIKSLPRVKNKNIDPFSKYERTTILKAFIDSEFYAYYHPFISFLFLTGCRPSEAIALRWHNISDEFVIFKEAFVEGKFKATTKTNESRRFPINGQLEILLSGLNHDYDKVFTAKNGGFINLNNFNRRAWNTILSDTNIRYRSPYNCRHTFITECLNQGVPVATLAKWVGNSPKIIYEYYAGASNAVVPII